MSKELRSEGDQYPVVDPEHENGQSLPPTVTDKYLFFYGWNGSHAETCLDQYYPTRFYDPDATGGYGDGYEEAAEEPPDAAMTATRQYFPSTEHYMMYWKALLMGDDEMALKIADCKQPAEAKKMGRLVRNFDKEVWSANCDMVVERGNLLKFTQNEQLKKTLLGTGDRILVEASPTDRIWGIGFNTKDAPDNEERWGENRLGKALMRVREQLRASSEKS